MGRGFCTSEVSIRNKDPDTTTTLNPAKTLYRPVGSPSKGRQQSEPGIAQHLFVMKKSVFISALLLLSCTTVVVFAQSKNSLGNVDELYFNHKKDKSVKQPAKQEKQTRQNDIALPDNLKDVELTDYYPGMFADILKGQQVDHSDNNPRHGGNQSYAGVYMPSWFINNYIDYWAMMPSWGYSIYFDPFYRGGYYPWLSLIGWNAYDFYGPWSMPRFYRNPWYSWYSPWYNPWYNPYAPWYNPWRPAPIWEPSRNVVYNNDRRGGSHVSDRGNYTTVRASGGYTSGSNGNTFVSTRPSQFNNTSRNNGSSVSNTVRVNNVNRGNPTRNEWNHSYNNTNSSRNNNINDNRAIVNSIRTSNNTIGIGTSGGNSSGRGSSGSSGGSGGSGGGRGSSGSTSSGSTSGSGTMVNSVR